MSWFWQESGLSNKKPVKFLGWIRGTQEDRQFLIDLGVRGQMSWRVEGEGPFGIYEHCEITLDVASLLRDNYLNFIPSTFTGVDSDGNQTKDQPLLYGSQEI